MSEQKPKIIKRDDAKQLQENQKRHELGLLKILAEKYPFEIARLAKKVELNNFIDKRITMN